MLLLSVLGIIFGSGAGYLPNGIVMGMTADVGNKAVFDLLYSSWVNNSDKVAEVQMNLHIGVVVFIDLALLAMSVLIASVGVWWNLKYEPLKLLAVREDE